MILAGFVLFFVLSVLLPLFRLAGVLIKSRF